MGYTNPYYNSSGNYPTMSSYSNNVFNSNAQKNNYFMNSSIKLEQKPFSPNLLNQTSSIYGYPPNMSSVVIKKE